VTDIEVPVPVKVLTTVLPEFFISIVQFEEYVIKATVIVVVSFKLSPLGEK
jgi:hypothetical protein